MSYILDALRRAQAERQRGAVPDLHSPAVAGPAPLPPERPAPLPWLLLAALGLAAVAAGGWWLARPQTGALDGAAPATAVAPAPPGAGAPLPPTAASTAAAAQPLTAPPPVLALPEPAASPAKAAAATAGERARAMAGKAPAPAELPAAGAPAAPAPGQGAIRQAPGAAAPANTPPAARTGNPTAGAVFALDELPPAVRAQLPALKLAGISYSANPQHRMAIVNGQVLHEGETAAPGLVLERIEPGRAVWRFRDYRWALTAP